MADLGPKRIAEFIAPFRVAPGSKVRLPHGFNPAGSRDVSVKYAKQVLRESVGLLAEYQARLAADPRFPKVSTEARDALQATKLELEAQAPKGVAPDPIEVELAAAAAKSARKAKKGKKA